MKRGCFSVCSAIYILAICIAIVEGLYTAEWAVEITDGGEGRALSIANKYGLRNLGKVRTISSKNCCIFLFVDWRTREYVSF